MGDMQPGLPSVNWDLALTVLSIVVTIVASAGGAVWKISSRMSADRDALASQIATLNNTLLAQVRLTEDRIEDKLSLIIQKFEARTLEIERDLASFKAYCERQFVSKETFTTVMSAQSSERASMRAELIDRFNRVDKRLDER